jgi:hypothetical protein
MQMQNKAPDTSLQQLDLDYNNTYQKRANSTWKCNTTRGRLIYISWKHLNQRRRHRRKHWDKNTKGHSMKTKNGKTKKHVEGALRLRGCDELSDKSQCSKTVKGARIAQSVEYRTEFCVCVKIIGPCSLM